MRFAEGNKNKYVKKISKIQYEFLNLKANCSLLIKNKDATMNNNEYKLTAKFPMINERGKL